MTSGTSRRGFLFGAAGFVAATGLTACAAPSGPGSPTAIDIGFCTDMSFHHAQALAMCQRVLGSDAGGPVLAAAAEILQNQSFERGLMYAWLQTWGESTAPPTEVMGWMGMATSPETMPGLATHEEMAALATAEGHAKGALFLELMRSHHLAGVAMAEAASGAGTERVRARAAQMVLAQNYDIAVFDRLLSTTYA